jgi:hypothetical protein
MRVIMVAVAGVVAATVAADQVQKTTNGRRHCFVVTADQIGRQAGDTRNIHDFHVQVIGGTIISHSSPAEWNGHHTGSSAEWETTTRPIRYTAGGTQHRGGFCIRVDGGTRLTWWTTAKDGSKIAQGVINLP